MRHSNLTSSRRDGRTTKESRKSSRAKWSCKAGVLDFKTGEAKCNFHQNDREFRALIRQVEGGIIEIPKKDTI